MRLALGVLALLAAPTALAHDLWLEKEGAAFVLYQGHRHSAHEGAETVSYPPAAVRGGVCLAGGEAWPLAPGKAYPVRYTGNCDALRVDFSTGYWSKTPWETLNRSRGEVKGAVKSWLSEDAVKRLERWTPATAVPLGNGLELTPTRDPFTLRPGDKLTVRVTLERKPLAEVPVAYDGEVRGTSGPDGLIAIRLRQPGMQYLSASIETSLADGKADTHIRATALQFELPR